LWYVFLQLWLFVKSCLVDNEISPGDAENLAEALKENSALTSLDLAGMLSFVTWTDRALAK